MCVNGGLVQNNPDSDRANDAFGFRGQVGKFLLGADLAPWRHTSQGGRRREESICDPQGASQNDPQTAIIVNPYLNIGA